MPFKKLDGLKTQDKTQITMIVIWVTELFMNQMGALRSSNTCYLHDSQYTELQKQFDSFLTIPKVEVFKQNKYIRKEKMYRMLHLIFFSIKPIYHKFKIILRNANWSFGYRNVSKEIAARYTI